MPNKIEYKLPIGWTIKSWCQAMQACNNVKFIPLSKMTEAQRQDMARKNDSRYADVQPSDYDTIVDYPVPRV